ncbi:MAG: rRNA pseudouridine synthase [Oscillospiraceae bacterium]|nr:rRNA pseudouridine synthase [Oscillospiraceae bacterium]
MERLDKLIAAQGGANPLSRKEVKALIARGRVTVDGVPAKSAEQKVDPDAVVIAVDGVPLALKKNLYLLLHKPKGYVSSTDGGDGPTVLELVPRSLSRRNLFPAGRLDKDTTGLMLITDDGQLAHRILSPKRHVKKRYLVTLDVPPTEEMANRFAEGIALSDGICKPAELSITGEYTALVTLTEGRYHQIKRMFGCCGATVIGLHRVAMGNLSLPDDLPEGAVREATAEELAAIEERQ